MKQTHTPTLSHDMKEQQWRVMWHKVAGNPQTHATVVVEKNGKRISCAARAKSEISCNVFDRNAPEIE